MEKKMKLTTIFIAVIAVFLFFGCASTGEVPEVITVEESKDPVVVEEKKEPVKIVTTVFYTVKEESFFGDGVKDEYQIFTYDDSGVFLLKVETFSADDVLQESIKYENAKSETSKGLASDGSGVFLAYCLTSKDSEGNVLIYEKFDIKDVLQSRSEYEYKNGMKTVWRVYGASDNLLSTTNYLYTGDLLTRIESLNSGGGLEEYFELSYDSNAMLLENNHYNIDGKIEDSRSFEYKDGFLSMEKIHRKNGSVQRKILYVNDQFGNPVETVFMDAGDNVQERLFKVYNSREIISYEE